MIIIKKLKDVKVKEGILLYGMGGGMGQIAKIVGDYLIDKLDPEKIIEIYGDVFPHVVAVDEEAIIHPITAEIYYKKINDQDVLILAGETQPYDERGQYEFAFKLLELLKEMGVKLIVTTGGYDIGYEPENPNVYIAATDKELLDEFKKKEEKLRLDFSSNIVGLAGLLPALAKYFGLKGVVLLAETLGHPMYVGLRGAKAILNVLNKVFGWNIDLKDLEKEIEEQKKEIEKAQKIEEMKKKEERRLPPTTYIG